MFHIHNNNALTWRIHVETGNRGVLNRYLPPAYRIAELLQFKPEVW